jgi:ribosome modulation factor
MGLLKMDLQEKVDQAYQEGKDAYFNGKNTQDNPYTGINENHQWEAWKEGYYNAAWND